MATGGWGSSLGAWSNPKQQQRLPLAGNGWDGAEDEMPIKAGVASQMSEVNLNAPTAAAAAPASKGAGITMPWQTTGQLQGYNSNPAAAPAAASAASAGLQANVGLAAREAAVAQREAALRAKEKELVAREAELKRNGGAPRKNWPWCFPIIHHDIGQDIPANMQETVRLAYWCYLGLAVCLLYNFAGACAMVGLNAPDKMSSWFLATIYLLSGLPLGLMLWYIKLYNTVASNGSVGMLGFFVFFIIHVAFCTWAAIAPPFAGERWSFTGFVAAMRAFDVSKVGGVFYIIGSCLWTLEALASWWCLKAVYFNFRSSGKQQQTQNELTKMALKSAMENKA